MTAPSPGIISSTMLNAYYDSHDAYLDAIAREMRTEYQEIHKQGLILQIDAPDLAMDRTHVPSRSLRRGIRQGNARSRSPRSTRASRAFRASACGCMSATATGKARTSTTSRSKRSCRRSTRPMSARCRSSSPIRAMRMNMPRSRSIRCPTHMILLPGVIETTSNFVEHPEVVARADRGRGGGGRRPRARDRLDRLRLRHLHQPRMGGGAGGVAEAEIAARGRRYRLAASCGERARRNASGPRRRKSAERNRARTAGCPRPR